MKLQGNWKGVTYFERIHNYIPDTPFILCIEEVEEDGTVSGSITEILLDESGAKRIQEYTRRTVPVSGHFAKESGELDLRELIKEGDTRERIAEGNLRICAVIDFIKEEIKGKLYDLRWDDCIQILELKKCCVTPEQEGIWLDLKASPLIDAIAEKIGNHTD